MSSEDYATLARDLRRPLDAAAPDRATELVRAATLAANGHNTQPWRFEIGDSRIAIRPDLGRRTPVVDPDDHHLYASLGCAAENLVLAATPFGLASEVESSADGIEIDLIPGDVEPSPLVRQIVVRQCTRVVYDGRKLATGDLDRLAEAGRRDGVECRIFESEEEMSKLSDLVVEANTEQLEDGAFVSELRDWIRFNVRHALASRDGLYSGVMGSPSLPAWLGRRILPLVLKPKSESEKTAVQVRSSAGLALFCAREDSPVGWIEAGRAYQRFALVATEMGLKHAFVNQPVEVPRFRPRVAELAGLTGRRPNLLVRFGYGPRATDSLRRPSQSVIR
jgi:hypothetical protein